MKNSLTPAACECGLKGTCRDCAGQVRHHVERSALDEGYTVALVFGHTVAAHVQGRERAARQGMAVLGRAGKPGGGLGGISGLVHAVQPTLSQLVRGILWDGQETPVGEGKPPWLKIIRRETGDTDAWLASYSKPLHPQQ